MCRHRKPSQLSYSLCGQSWLVLDACIPDEAGRVWSCLARCAVPTHRYMSTVLYNYNRNPNTSH